MKAAIMAIGIETSGIKYHGCPWVAHDTAPAIARIGIYFPHRYPNRFAKLFMSVTRASRMLADLKAVRGASRLVVLLLRGGLLERLPGVLHAGGEYHKRGLSGLLPPGNAIFKSRRSLGISILYALLRKGRTTGDCNG